MPPVRSLADLDLSKTYTYADYLTWQFEGWEELHRGNLVLPPVSWPTSHQVVLGNLSAEYATPGLVPSHTLTALAVEWAEVFAE